MKILVLLLLTSCAVTERNTPETYNHKMKQCMKEFSNQGYDAEAVIKICKAIYEQRK